MSAPGGDASVRKEVSMNSKRILDRVFHRIAGVGPLVFFAVATVEGFLRVDYDPIAQPISALALGPRGWIQEVNFVLLAASFFSFAAVLRTEFRHGVASVAAPAVFVIMTIGVSLALAFPMDAPDAVPTSIGRLHVAGGFLVFPWMPVGLFLAARRFRRDARWQPYFAYTLATALVCLATIVFFLLFVGPPPAPRPLSRLTGLVQRVQIVPFFTWISIIAFRAYGKPNAAAVAAEADDEARAFSA
jgi:hypothetical protein